MAIDLDMSAWTLERRRTDRSRAMQKPLPVEVRPTPNQSYAELMATLDRIHRRYLDVIRLELDHMGVKDINPSQALMLLSVGERDVPVRDLIQRGGYPASTASYNIKKLVDYGYLDQERAANDRRSIRLSLTERGRGVVRSIKALEDRHVELAQEEPELVEAMAEATRTLRHIDRIWTEFMTFG